MLGFLEVSFVFLRAKISGTKQRIASNELYYNKKNQSFLRFNAVSPSSRVKPVTDRTRADNEANRQQAQ